MTRDELLHLLTLERFAPRPTRPEPPKDTPLDKARRRRELDDAVLAHEQQRADTA